MNALSGSRLYTHADAKVVVPNVAHRDELGECAWAGHVDNMFGQPSVKAK